MARLSEQEQQDIIRRQGAGKAMLRYLEDYLRDAGHDQLYSSSSERATVSSVAPSHGV